MTIHHVSTFTGKGPISWESRPLPTHAGMDPALLGLEQVAQPAPHARGDGP